MERFQKEFTVTSSETMYRAKDGTEFKSEENCRKYEDTARCALMSILCKFGKRFAKDDEYYKFDYLITGGEEGDYWLVKVSDEQKRQLFLAILEELDKDWLTHNFWYSTKGIEVGGEYIVFQNCDDNVSVYSKDSLTTQFMDMVSKIFGKNKEN